MGCIFCKIIAGKINAAKIFENENVIVIADINPQAQWHYLAIPKQHIASLNDLTQHETQTVLPQLFEAATIVATQKNFKTQGYRTVINNQAQAGQSVFHLHMHILSGNALSNTFA